jgi:hypothetical protein
MTFKRDERSLTDDDFALFHEKGASYMLSFFAMNETAATMLFIRYYAHLIANQDTIEEVGVATMMKDAQKLIGKMHLEYYATKMLSSELVLESYKASLSHFLAHEDVLKMLLAKQSVPSI